jgi:tetratricopeptide (TPR) repeat protein
MFPDKNGDEASSPMDETTVPPTTDDPVKPSDADLPQAEPLTPELVEDETVRGDFMIRWVVVLLAVLLGCNTIRDTDTLLRIRTGQYIAANGWLPPRTDPFSYTTAERPWINTAWLFDLLISGVHSLAGPVGLTLVKAFLGGVIFWILSRITKPRVSSWWGSVCAGLALLAVHPRLTVRPEIVTLLGIAVTLWVLHRWREGGKPKELWALPAVFLLWGNLDPHMFLGPAILTLYVIGDAVGDLFSVSRIESLRRRQLWMVLGTGLLATFINPFGWHAVLSPLSLYGVEYPVFREYFTAGGVTAFASSLPLYDTASWKPPSVPTLIGATLVCITGIVLMLNRRHLDWGHVFVFAGIVAAAAMARNELAAAAVVCVVLASVNAQEWYKATFRQTYSVEPSELLFSRGGRAVTVLALFAVAVLVVSGRIGGPAVGVGLHHELASADERLRKAEADAMDARPFAFSLQQGNLLIWSGRKSFADTRVALFHGKGDDNLLSLHAKIRDALRSGENPELWQKTFDRLEVTHAVALLVGSRPDYASYFGLFRSREWALTNLNSAAGVFYRVSSADTKRQAQLRAYVVGHQVVFADDAFQKATRKTADRLDWARPISWYSSTFFKRDEPTPSAIRLAMHYREHLRGNYMDPSMPLALAYLAIRNANVGLAENPQNANGHLVLGDVYRILAQHESGLAGTQFSGTLRTMRYYQMIAAFHQARILKPDDPDVVRRIYEVFLERRHFEAALQALDDYERLTADVDTTNKPLLKQRNKTDIKYREQLEKIGKEAGERIDRILSSPEGSVETRQLAAAQTAINAGQIERALELTEEVLASNSSHLQAMMFHISLLFERGRAEEANSKASSLLQSVGSNEIPQLRSYSAYGALGHVDYKRASALWQEEVDEREQQIAPILLHTFPMSGSLPGNRLQPWPISRFQAIGLQFNVSYATSTSLLRAAICHMEAGRPKEAEVSLRRILRDSPETPLRPLVWLYATMVTGDQFPLHPPSNRIPITPDLFESEIDPNKKTSNKKTSNKKTPPDDTNPKK